jgi:hypothetical protein
MTYHRGHATIEDFAQDNDLGFLHETSQGMGGIAQTLDDDAAWTYEGPRPPTAGQRRDILDRLQTALEVDALSHRRRPRWWHGRSG